MSPLNKLTFHYRLRCPRWNMVFVHISSTRGRCGAALTAAVSSPAPAVGCRCFPADIQTTRRCGGRQAASAGRGHTLRSTSNHHRLSHCHGLSDREKQQQRFLFPTREWNFKAWKQSHAAGRHDPADISDREDQKVATTTRKPQRRSSRCLFFFFFHARRERRHPAWEEAPRSGTPVGLTLIVSGESPQHFPCSFLRIYQRNSHRLTFRDTYTTLHHPALTQNGLNYVYFAALGVNAAVCCVSYSVCPIHRWMASFN